MSDRLSPLRRAIGVIVALASLTLCASASAQAHANIPGVTTVPNQPDTAAARGPMPSPQVSAPTTATTPEAAATEAGVEPFGASLFAGTFAGQRQDGINGAYRILPGDRVLVNVWGLLSMNEVYTVDSQGNILLPQIGPVHLAGVENARLTEMVRGGIARIYRSGVDVYTNLLTASPVAVYVTGGVVRPGRYAGTPSDTPLFFVAQAGGIDAGVGSYRHIKVLRQGAEIANVDLYAFLLEGALPTVQFADGDVILVERRGPTVELRGHRTQPELVELPAEPFTGADVLAVVSTSPRLAEITLQGLRGGASVMRAFTRDSFMSTTLASGDQITLQGLRLTGEILVRLEGEFYGRSVLAVHRGARLLDVLSHVAVDPDLANLDGVHVRRASVANEQRRAIQDSLDRLERSAMLALSSTAGETEIRVREAELVRAFVANARNIQPLGRVVTTQAGTTRNMVLEEGDVIVIPTRTTVVTTVGEVQVAQAIMYEPGLTVHDCVQRSGGLSNRADRRRMLLVRPSSEVIQVDGGAFVHPGDQVMVMPRIDRKLLQNFSDVTTVLYQIAVGAAVILRAF